MRRAATPRVGPHQSIRASSGRRARAAASARAGPAPSGAASGRPSRGPRRGRRGDTRASRFRRPRQKASASRASATDVPQGASVSTSNAGRGSSCRVGANMAHRLRAAPARRTLLRDDGRARQSRHGLQLGHTPSRPDRCATRVVACHAPGTAHAPGRLDRPPGGAVLRRREDRPASGLSARHGDRAVASGRRRDRRAGALRDAPVAGHRHRRPAGRRLLLAAGHRARPDARQHARGRRRRRPPAPPDRRPDGPGAGGRRVRAGRRRRRGDADQRELRGHVAAPRGGHPGRPVRRGLADVVAFGLLGRAGGHPADPHLGDPRSARALALGPARGGRGADRPRAAGRASVAARRSVRRLPRAHLGRAALRAAGSGHGAGRRRRRSPFGTRRTTPGRSSASRSPTASSRASCSWPPRR